jgi:hypothetical protein
MANSYVEFYERDSLVDPHGGDYSALYDAFASSTQTYQELHQHFGLANDYAVFAILGSNNCIYLFHRLARHTTPLGVPRSTAENRVVAIQGNLTSVGANYVTVPTVFFSAIDATGVPTADDINTGLDNDTAQEQLATQAGGDRVITRRAMLVPPPYVPAFFKRLARGPITPRSLWDLAERIQQRRSVSVSCRVFIDWCRVVVAGGVGEDNPLRSTAATGFPSVIIVDDPLSQSRAAMMAADFPPPVSAAAPMQPLVDMIGGLRADNARWEERKQRQKDMEAATKSSPAHRWPTSVHRLLRICQVDDKRDLPPVWAALCSAGVKHDRMTLASFCLEPGTDVEATLRPFVPPAVSVEVARAVSQLQFENGKDTLDGCLSIFALSYPDQPSILAANNLSSIVDLQSNGGVSLTHTELARQIKAQSVKLPTDWSQLRFLFSAYHHWLQVLLGEDHSLPRAFHALVDSELDSVQATMTDNCATHRFCAGLLRSIQLHTWDWIRKQQVTDAILAAPRYSDIGTKVVLEDFRMPKLPLVVAALLVKAPVVPQNASTAAPAPAPPAASNQAAAPTGKGRGKRVDLPEALRTQGIYNPSLESKIHLLVRKKRPPLNSANNQFCLNYHVKGWCTDTCDRSHDPNTAADSATLVAYLKETLPLLDAEAPSQKA